MRSRTGNLWLLIFLLSGVSSFADDWSGWRGPRRDGNSPGSPWPSSLGELRELWKVELGKGYPGPVVTTDRVFTVETVDRKTVAARALDRRTGELLWRVEWTGTGKVPFFAATNGDWVRSTPAYDGTTLYVGDMAEVLRALDGQTGEERWSVDFPARFGTEVPDFGFASSPVVDGEYILVQAANSLVKIDRRSGETVWRALAGSGKIASSGAFSSPVLAEVAGRRQVIVLTREGLHGVDPADGTVLWSQSVPNFRGMNILTPVIHGDGVFTSPYRNGSLFYRLRTESEAGSVFVEESWSNPASGYMSTPVVVGDHAYMLLGNRRLACIDLRSGEFLWKTEKSFGRYWSLVNRGDKILALDEDGTLYLFLASPESFQLLDSRKVREDEAWAHLAVSGEEVFVRGLKGIVALSWSADPARTTGR